VFCVGTKGFVVTRLRAGRPRKCGSITGTDDRFFLFSKASRRSLELIQFSVQSVQEVMRTGLEAGHVYLVPMLGMNGVILLLPPQGSLTYTKDLAS